MIWRLSELADTSAAAFGLVLLASIYFLAFGLNLSVIDQREHLLPNRIIFPSYVVAAVLLGTAAAIAGHWDDLLRMLLAAATMWCFYFVLRLVYPPGMGFGDVKLAGLLGLYTGYLSWGHALIGSVTAFLLAGLTGLWLILTHRRSLKSRIPFGPFMILGAAAALALIPPPVA